MTRTISPANAIASPPGASPGASPEASLAAALEHDLDVLRRAGLGRVLRQVEHRDGAQVVLDGRRVVDFSSNDYLGLAADPRLADAVAGAVASDATGAAAARSIAGNHPLHESLERALAELKGAEAALLFPSGFAANVGAIPALANRGDVIYSDALNHASIIDGCRLSRATTRTFPHADLDALAAMLREDRGTYRRRWIVVEGVYSMDGDLFPLDRLVGLARSDGAWTYVDDAHATGVLGERGTGSAEHWGVEREIDVTVGTLGKAFGVVGAFVAGARPVRELLLNRARSFVFTTGSPPALAAAALAALRIARAEPWRRDRLRANSERLRAGLAALARPVPDTHPGHILPVMLGGAEATVEVGARLRERGFLVGAVRPPTVPLGGSRLRITVSAAHTEDEIDRLLDALADLLPRADGARAGATFATPAAPVAPVSTSRADRRASSAPPPPEWSALDAAHVWHPYTQHAVSPTSVPVVRGDGAYLHDARGRRIFDAISSWWVTLHGHAHPAIGAAVAAQARVLEQVIFAGFTHEPAARLAAELVERLPEGLTRIFYSDDGSTAVEVALKMALQLAAQRGVRRPIIAALENAYHGDTFGAMSASARGTFTAPFVDQLFDVARLPDPSEGDAVLALSTLLDARGRDVVAVIVEPLLLGAGGMHVWRAEDLVRIRALTAEAGVPLIADEVLTGFGRTTTDEPTGPRAVRAPRAGPSGGGGASVGVGDEDAGAAGPAALFACDVAGIAPDIMCLSKGLTGGFLPLGVTAAREEIFASFLSTDRRQTFFHGHSFTANPLACAAARASLSLLDHACAARRAAIARTHREQLARMASFPSVHRTRTIGTVAAFDVGGAGGEESYLDPIGPKLAAFALEHDVLLRPLGNVVYLLPPLCATPEEIVTVYDVIARFLEGS